MPTVLKTENLSKRYIISHLGTQNQRNFREEIAHRVKSIFKRNTRHFPYKTKESFWALDDVNLEIEQGNRVAIIGSNGAGKSTLLKILSRITGPSAGVVKIKGRVACLLEVGTGFHDELTGRENIFLNGAILGMRKIEIQKRFDEIVTFADVEQFLDVPVKRYSSGMRVRLAFAVAAHLESEILIVDEVLAVGDAAFQKKCIGKMQSLSTGTGRTVLFVSHNISAVKGLCESGILLDHGRVASTGNIDEVTSDYLGRAYTGSESLEWNNVPMPIDFAGDAYVHRIAVVNSKGVLAERFLDHKESYIVKIETSILRESDNLAFFLAVYTNDQQLLLLSDIHDSFDSRGWKLKKGNAVISVPLPVNLLMSNHYKLEISCVVHYKKWFLAPQSEHQLPFYIKPEDFNAMGYDMNSHPYTGSKRPGFLAGNLEWSISYN